ncbi:MAG: ATP-binding protein [Myxococcota bacterium]|nr:ATP-binding protein [Myxococcota bacterium]
MSDRPTKQRMSIRRLRVLFLTALVVGLTLFTGVTVALVGNLSERFGPEVRADLQWRALRGAQELARATDVGLAMQDPIVVREGFGVHAESADVQTIVALDGEDKLVARHGALADRRALFAGEPGVLTSTRTSLSSWAPAVIEGVTVGRVAIAVSTRRLDEAQAQLTQVTRITLIAGGAGLVLGVLAIMFFTRTITARDRQLTHYANNLEQMVVIRTAELDERNGEMRLVLDTVAQGFVMIDTFGRMANERSAIVDVWFGEPATEGTIMAYLEPQAPEFAAWFELALSTLRDGFIPVDLCMAQMPKRFAVTGRAYEVSYRTILDGARLERLLVVIDDVTAQVVRERSEREQRELMGMFQRITSDREGVDELMTNVGELLGVLASPCEIVVERRILHTLKGNCALFGLELYSELCHTIESELAETLEPLSVVQRTALLEGWTTVASWMSRLRGATRDDIVEVERAELAQVIKRAEQGVSGPEIAAALARWTLEPVARRFDRLAQHAQSLARRLGKGELAVDIVDGGVRLDGANWSAFWAAAVHAVRNSIDHGIEAGDERTALGKPATGRLRFVAEYEPGSTTIAFSDDGHGIDWEAVRARAGAAGIPCTTPDDLVAALFADGVTTRDTVSETSGRGIGMAALLQAVTDLGGTIEVTTVLGAGTTVLCRFPSTDPQVLGGRPRTRPANSLTYTSKIPLIRRDADRVAP